MAKWVAKATMQRILGLLPASHKWNQIFQENFTQSLKLTDTVFESKLRHCRRHINALRNEKGTLPTDFTVFDLGTGWFPVVPIGMFLCGAGLVHTCDILPLVKMKRLRSVIARFIEFAERGALTSYLPDVLPERIALLQSVLSNSQYTAPAELLQALSVHLLVCDAQNTGLADQSVDLMISTEVIMHIPQPVIAGIFREFHRIAKPNGVMSHLIDMTDLNSYFDSSITPFHYLRFSRTAWKLINNSITPMNRLRIPDYRREVENANFRIEAEDNTPGILADLQRVPLAKQFRHYSAEDLLVIRSWLTAKAQVAAQPMQRQPDHA